MAKKSRAAGEGNIFQRDDGYWVGRLSLGKDAGGKRQRKTVYGSTQAEVVSKLAALRQKLSTAPKMLFAKDTVGGFLQRWLDDDVAINKAGRTHQEYDLAIRLYVNPFLGGELLANLDGEKLVAWQAELSRKGHTANTRLRAIRVLRNALNKAVKLRILQFNPMAAVDKPKVQRKEVRPLEPEECHRLIQACASHRVGEIITLAAMTGLRKGELLALEWSAVNISEGVLVVRRALQEVRKKGLSVKEPKTRAGRRVVTLGQQAIEALQSRMKKALDEGFHPDEVPLVFPDSQGGFFWYSNFDRQVWYPIRKASGIPASTKFHDLRHTQASLMLAAGVDLKLIQERLGHSDFGTTANLYTHLLTDAQADATRRLDDLMASRKG